MMKIIKKFEMNFLLKTFKDHLLHRIDQMFIGGNTNEFETILIIADQYDFKEIIEKCVLLVNHQYKYFKGEMQIFCEDYNQISRATKAKLVIQKARQHIREIDKAMRINGLIEEQNYLTVERTQHKQQPWSTFMEQKPILTPSQQTSAFEKSTSSFNPQKKEEEEDSNDSSEWLSLKSKFSGFGSMKPEASSLKNQTGSKGTRPKGFVSERKTTEEVRKQIIDLPKLSGGELGKATTEVITGNETTQSAPNIDNSKKNDIPSPETFATGFSFTKSYETSNNKSNKNSGFSFGSNDTLAKSFGSKSNEKNGFSFAPIGMANTKELPSISSD